MTNLEGRVALVTGASSGIGEAAAMALAVSGCAVAIFARRKERLEDLAARIEDETGKKALVIEGDVRENEAAVQAVSATVARFGRLDILVNNAGVMYVGPVASADVSDWKNMIDINVLGLMYFTHAAIPELKKQGGNIVNISSVSGRLVSSRSAVYSATKFAVNAFSDGIRQELAADRIRVTVIEPGAVLTELTDHIADSSTKDTVKKWVATMEALQSEDIASAIVYAAGQPAHVNVNEILIRPTDQTF
ncbi:MAG: SDR family NAD(P)-dependent oxidoreductase [Cyanobacteria bacterium HKST-UBA02]|nr:SDR family NAD(P)-dependent oxidoreductase [Cyanobacteria bacterium HKST-UBA02]